MRLAVNPKERLNRCRRESTEEGELAPLAA
jgi:hypothetical protein